MSVGGWIGCDPRLQWFEPLDKNNILAVATFVYKCRNYTLTINTVINWNTTCNDWLV